jgi:AMMECR1 domain-containing protein
VGSLTAVEPNVVLETLRSARLAANHDPRFEAVRADEVEQLAIEVSVLLPSEPVGSTRDLDPATYGVVVRDAKGRRGLLLPGIDGINDASTQVEIARRKAGIPAGVPVELERFRVLKFSDDAQVS